MRAFASACDRRLCRSDQHQEGGSGSADLIRFNLIVQVTVGFRFQLNAQVRARDDGTFTQLGVIGDLDAALEH
jgi:hypothetical protein